MYMHAKSKLQMTSTLMSLRLQRQGKEMNLRILVYFYRKKGYSERI